MKLNIKKILLSGVLSISMASNLFSPILAQEESEPEEIVEESQEQEEILEVEEEEVIEVENELKHYNGFTYDVTPLNAIQILGYTGSETSLIIPETIEGKPVKYIYFQAFATQPIEEVYLPDNLEEIGDGAFEACSKLRTVLHWGNKLRSIGEKAFSGCDLTEIVIPETVTYLGREAFNNNTDLKILKYYASNLDSVTGQMGCFNYCGFKDEHGFEMFVGSNVQKLPDYLFRAVVKPDNTFEYARITKITGAENLREIGSYTFGNCNKLKELTLPESVTTIRSNAFFNCYYLSKIYFSSKIQTIESNAFSECPILWYMGFEKNPPVLGENALENLTVEMHYPESNSIAWEKTKESNYGATQVKWVGDLDSKLTHNETMDSKEFTSPNWPNDYPSNCTFENTSRHYSYPSAYSIGIDFDENSVTEARYDYVQIVSSKQTYKYSGTDFPKHLVVPDNKVDIGFVSDGSVEKSGFKAKVYPIFHDDVTITSPNWPNNYPNGVHIEKELNFDGAKRIDIVFDPTSCTEGHGTIFNDYVEIFDRDGKSKGKFGGQIIYGTHIDDSYVKVVFHSDGSISDKGFSLRLIPDY
ncbi:MAG: leucine-rich repeat protein, partial [Firmicutes bacterium]|nr:leucine-rich repeat protein [Bacillota bacterium]